MSETNGTADDRYTGRAISELLLTRDALMAEVKQVEAAIVHAAESQQRELDRVLGAIGTTTRKTQRSADFRARLSASAKARWANARAQGFAPKNLPPKYQTVNA